MRKLIFATAALLSAATISAQEVVEAQAQTESATVSTAKKFKPGSERFGAEAGFNFGSGFGLSGGTLNCNYTLSDELMIRLGFGLDVVKDVDKTENETSHETTTSFDIKPGIVYSFTGTDRLEPYVGGEVVFGFDANHNEGNEPDVRVSQKHFGLNAVSGFNVYVCQDLYVGAEVGFGFLVVPGKVTKTENGTQTDESHDEGHTTHIRALCNPAIRIGWKF